MTVEFTRPGSTRGLRAVDGVDLDVREGEAVGLVGESGCGKTTLANALLGLVRPSSGDVRFRGRSLSSLNSREMFSFRREAQMVFQDPFSSLNPRLSVHECISEVVRVHGTAARIAADVQQRADGGRGRWGRRRKEREAVDGLLRLVELDPGTSARYTHEFSGGQRQRIGIARALAPVPSLIVADEPVSALDVSVQAQILNLMRDLQTRLGLAYLLIAHDLAVVKYMCERVIVMYLGKFVEWGPADAVLAHPSHPYTEALLSAVPDVEAGLSGRRGGVRRIVLRGDVPSPLEKIDGCAFHPRCHRARDVCRRETPHACKIGDARASVCHFAERLAGSFPASP